MAQHYVLRYNYVTDYFARRDAFRKAHLAHINKEVDAGNILLTGVLPEKNGAMMIFYCENPEFVKNFAEHDPYMAEGLIADYEVVLWDIAAGVPAMVHPHGTHA